MPIFIKNIKSRLLLPVFIVLFITVILQVMVNVGLTSQKLDGMKNSVTQSLQDSATNISVNLSDAQKAINNQMQALAVRASDSLSTDLKQKLEKERQGIGKQIEATLMSGARRVGEVIAAVSPPAMWDKDIPELTRMAQMADKDESVIFAAFFGQDGKYMTRYLNRKDPRVLNLLKNGKGRGSINKIIDASSRDDNVRLLKINISPNDVVIGQFVMGVSMEKVQEQLAALKQGFEVLNQSSKENVGKVINEQGQQVAVSLKQSLNNVETALDQGVQSTSKQIQAQSRALTWQLTLLSLVLGVALILIMVFVLSVRVVARISQLRSAIREVAEGDADLTRRLDIQGNDEIVETAQGFNEFIVRLQKMVVAINENAQQASHNSDQLVEIANATSANVDGQRIEIDQISSAISEMSSTAQHVAESIQNAANGIESIRSETGESASIAMMVRQQLEKLRSNIQQTQEVVARLDAHSHDIGSVLDVIRSIAEQTNLLALNAAIEAARAGESGRGFAVVADEVRALASKTQQSTEEIQRLIESLQEGSREAVSQTESAVKCAMDSGQSFQESDRHIEAVNAAVDAIFSQATEISSMAEEQSSVTEEIHRNIVNISEASEETSRAVQASTKASQDIQNIINEVSSQVNQFKT